MYMCKYFHVEKVHGYGTLFFVKRGSSSGGVFGTLFKIGQFGILCSDDRFDMQSSTPHFLCKRTMSTTPFDPSTNVNSFDSCPKRYATTGVDVRGNLSTKNKGTDKLTKNGYKFCTSCLDKIDRFL